MNRHLRSTTPRCVPHYHIVREKKVHHCLLEDTPSAEPEGAEKVMWRWRLCNHQYFKSQFSHLTSKFNRNFNHPVFTLNVTIRMILFYPIILPYLGTPITWAPHQSCRWYRFCTGLAQNTCRSFHVTPT